ncbi:CAP domain-containing protein, partial [Lactobacillus crispatus]
ILLQNKILRAVIIPKATALPNNQNTFFNALIQKGWHQNFFVRQYVLSNPIITDE